MPNAVEHRDDDRDLRPRAGRAPPRRRGRRRPRRRRGGPCRTGSGRRATAGASRCPSSRPGASGWYSPTRRAMKSSRPRTALTGVPSGGRTESGRRRRRGSRARRCRAASVGWFAAVTAGHPAHVPCASLCAVTPRGEATDRKILALLAADGRMSFTDLGKATGLSTSAVHQRVKRLEQRGMIRGYGATVDHDADGPAADGVHLDHARSTRPQPDDYPERLARHRRRSSRAGRSPARSPTSSRSASPTPRDLEDLLARVRSAANVSTRTTIVLSTPYENRPLG